MSKTRKVNRKPTPTRSKLAQARNSNLRYTQLNVLVNVHEHKAIADAAYKARVTMAEYVRQRVLGGGRIEVGASGAKGGSPEPVATERVPSADEAGCALLMSHEQRDELAANAEALAEQARAERFLRLMNMRLNAQGASEAATAAERGTEQPHGEAVSTPARDFLLVGSTEAQVDVSETERPYPSAHWTINLSPEQLRTFEISMAELAERNEDAQHTEEQALRALDEYGNAPIELAEQPQTIETQGA